MSALEFLMTKLHYRPGMIRDVKVDGYTFYNLPIYEHGGKALRKLFDKYKDSIMGNIVKHLGRYSFTQL